VKNLFSEIFLLFVVCASGATFAQSSEQVDCARKAITVGGLNSDQAVKLCVNGGTPQSVDCTGRAMKDAFLTADQAVELCANKALRLENMVKFIQ
jgi:hypothetical protein